MAFDRPTVSVDGLELRAPIEPEGRKLYDLKIKMGDDTDERRKEFEGVLNRYHVEFALLSSSDQEVCYEARHRHSPSSIRFYSDRTAGLPSTDCAQMVVEVLRGKLKLFRNCFANADTGPPRS